MAPTLLASYEVDSAASNLTSLVTPSFTPSNGEVIVVKAVAENNNCVPGTPTGGSQTYTSRASSAASSNVAAAIFTAVVASSPGSMTITVPWTGTAKWHSMVVERWGSAQLAGTPATNSTKTGSGAPSATVTTVAANSIVTTLDGDWNANAPGTPAYRSSATQDGLHNKSTGNYVAYYFYQSAASAGSQTIGMTAPTGQAWTLLGIEVQAGASDVNEPTTPAGTGWSGTAAQSIVGVVAGLTAAAVAWAGTTATLRADVQQTSTPASAAWSGTTANLSIGAGGGTEYSGFADAYASNLTDGNDTSLKSAATEFYAASRSDVTCVGVRVYCPVAAGTAVTVQLQNDTNADGKPDNVLASTVTTTITSATWVAAHFTTGVALTPGVYYWATVFCDTGQTFRYGFVSEEFGSLRPIHPGDDEWTSLTGMYWANGAETASGNGSYSTSGQFPDTSFNSAWYGIDPIVTVAGGGTDVAAAATPAASAWAGTSASTVIDAAAGTEPAAYAWAGTQCTLTAAASVTEPTAPAAAAWAGTTGRTVVDQVDPGKPGAAAWAGTTARLAAGVVEQSRPAGYTWSSAAPVLDVADVLEGTGPPAVAWAGAPVNLSIGAGSGTIEPAKPSGLAWAGTASRLATTTVAAATPTGHAWSGAPARTVIDQLEQAKPGSYAWAGVSCVLSAGAASDVIEPGKPAATAWSGVKATLTADQVGAARPAGIAWVGCPTTLTLGVPPGGPAVLAWAGTPVGITQGSTPVVVTGAARPLTTVTGTDGPLTTVTATDRPSVVVTSI